MRVNPRTLQKVMLDSIRHHQHKGVGPREPEQGRHFAPKPPRRNMPARAVRPVNLPSSGGSERGASPSPGEGGASPGGGGDGEDGGDSSDGDGEPPLIARLFRSLGREKSLLEGIRSEIDAFLSRGGCSA